MGDLLSCIERMEGRYGCRYEAPATPVCLTAFPVTHRIEAGAHGAAWAHISTGSFHLVNWRVCNASGNVIVYGCERNYAQSIVGRLRALRWALKHVGCYGTAIRVYPRARTHGRR